MVISHICSKVFKNSPLLPLTMRKKGVFWVLFVLSIGFSFAFFVHAHDAEPLKHVGTPNTMCHESPSVACIMIAELLMEFVRKIMVHVLQQIKLILLVNPVILI